MEVLACKTGILFCSFDILVFVVLFTEFGCVVLFLLTIVCVLKLRFCSIFLDLIIGA